MPSSICDTAYALLGQDERRLVVDNRVNPERGFAVFGLCAVAAFVESDAAGTQVGFKHILPTVPDAVDADAVVHIQPAVRTAERGHGLARVQHIQRPARFKVDRGAVFHYDKAEGGILNRKLLFRPVAPRVAGRELFAQLLINRADAVFRLVVVHAPEGKVKRVRSDIDQRTAALLIFVEKHAPGRNGSRRSAVALA